jgi:hypothetical protein
MRHHPVSPSVPKEVVVQVPVDTAPMFLPHPDGCASNAHLQALEERLRGVESSSRGLDGLKDRQDVLQQEVKQVRCVSIRLARVCL